jgi:hypothetical protein
MCGVNECRSSKYISVLTQCVSSGLNCTLDSITQVTGIWLAVMNGRQARWHTCHDGF